MKLVAGLRNGAGEIACTGPRSLAEGGRHGFSVLLCILRCGGGEFTLEAFAVRAIEPAIDALRIVHLQQLCAELWPGAKFVHQECE